MCCSLRVLVRDRPAMPSRRMLAILGYLVFPRPRAPRVVATLTREAVARASACLRASSFQTRLSSDPKDDLGTRGIRERRYARDGHVNDDGTQASRFVAMVSGISKYSCPCCTAVAMILITHFVQPVFEGVLSSSECSRLVPERRSKHTPCVCSAAHPDMGHQGG